jgi:hypothetical protein
MGNIVEGWANTTEQGLLTLFDGSEDSLQKLDVVMTGMFVEGKGGVGSYPPTGVTTLANLHQDIAKSMFAFSIPSIWAAAGTYAFIVDSQIDCGTADADNPLIPGWFTSDIAAATFVCTRGKIYYLLSFDGDISSYTNVGFNPPPGLDSLTGDASPYAGLKRDDLVIG